MNRAELGVLLGGAAPVDLARTKAAAAELAARNGRPVFVSLAEDGLLGAAPAGELAYAKSLPLRGRSTSSAPAIR